MQSKDATPETKETEAAAAPAAAPVYACFCVLCRKPFNSRLLKDSICPGCFYGGLQLDSRSIVAATW